MAGSAAKGGRMRAPARRASILSAGLEAFAEKGYSEASFGDIARRAGVARTVLYDHFPSKRALYLAVLAEQNAAFVARIGAGINSDGNAQERLRASVDATIGFAKSDPHAWKLLNDNSVGADPEIREVHRGHLEARVREVAAMLTPDLESVGVEAKSLTAQLVVEMINGSIVAAVSWWGRHQDVDDATVAEIAERLFWGGLAGFSMPD